jgi:hypothetical protein
MSSHDTPDHICSPDCDDNIDTTRPFVLVLQFPSMPLKDAEFIINGVLFGLDKEIHGSLVHLRIYRPRTLGKILFKLVEQSDLMLNQIDFISNENKLRLHFT